MDRSSAVAESAASALARDRHRSLGAALALSSGRYQPLVILAIALGAGIVLGRYVSPFPVATTAATSARASFATWYVLGLVSTMLFALARYQRRDRLAAWLLLLSVAMLGASWQHARWRLFDAHEIARYATSVPSPACVELIALEAPRIVAAPAETPLRAIPVGERSRLAVVLTRIRSARQWHTASGHCELSVEGHLLGVEPGDRLRVFGQLARVAPPLNPGQADFAAHARADRRLVRLNCSAPESVALIERTSRLGPGALLSAIRDAGQRAVREFVRPEQAGLAAAILLGAREGITREETEPYRLTGTVHVLVVSGLNVAILAAGFYALVRIGLLGRLAGFSAIVLLVVCYTLVADAQPPVVRAAVLAIAVGIASWSGRPVISFNSLAAAAIFVLVLNPSDLFRAGPQLSFLAVGSLIWVGNWSRSRGRQHEPLEELLDSARPRALRALRWFARRSLWIMVASLGVWLVTLPLLLHQFHIAAPIAVLISPLVWLIVAVAMWSGFAMLVVGWLVPPVGSLGGWICACALASLDRLVAWCEALPGAQFWAPGPPCWWVVGLYAGLLVLVLAPRALGSARWRVGALCLWIVVGTSPALARWYSRDELTCSFVAVGHGACVVLEAPGGETLLYDAGSLGSPLYATETISSFLWSRGIRRLDGVVVSHADIDHYNALPGLVERFDVGAVYVSPTMFDGFDDASSQGGPAVLRTALQHAKVPIHEIAAGSRLQLGPEVRIEVLHPTRRGVIGSDNANSLTLGVEYEGHRVLLPGDLESPGLEDVLAEAPYDCDVLLAPHHGSRRSDPPGFAAWSRPEWVVISGGSETTAPVVATYEATGAGVLATDVAGSVIFSLRNDEIIATTWLAPLGR